MEIRVLRYFLTVVREEGINRAAEALHITQPTLSRQLFQLEREVGVKLFNRGAKKITLTNEGILLRRRAEEILALVDRTEQELIEQDEQVEGRVVIGGGELAAMQELPKIISSFREKYPLVTFDIFTGNADVVKEQMEKGLIDIGVLMVQSGLAYSLVIEGSVPFLDKEKIIFRPVSPRLTSNSVLAWKKQQPFCLAATKFIEHMKCLLSMR